MVSRRPRTAGARDPGLGARPAVFSAYLTRHAVGRHLDASGSLRKLLLVVNGMARYFGPSTVVDTTNQSPACGWVKRVKYSVMTAFSLYGAPLRRSHHGNTLVVTTFNA